MKTNLRKWFLQGAENDKYYLELSLKDRYYYQIGQKLFLTGFFIKHNLSSFTEGKTGRDYVQGVVNRGKWLRKNHYFRSSPFNVIDFTIMLPKMISTGPDPASRILVKKLIGKGV